MLDTTGERLIHCPQQPHSPPRVLFMDEERTLCAVAERLLMLLGYAPACVYDGAQTIALYHCALRSGRPFAVVILDLTVKGGMGAYDAMLRLRKLDPQVKAIVSSGYWNNPIIRHYWHYGFAAALAKPYSQKELAEAIQRAIGTRNPETYAN